MVLVDSSIWIRGLRGDQPYKQELDRLLAADEVCGHELVYGELLIGDKGGRKQFLALYERIYTASGVSHREVVQFVRDKRLHGIGVGWIDINLLASAILEKAQLWTSDAPLLAVANEFGVAYEIGVSGGPA